MRRINMPSTIRREVDKSWGAQPVSRGGLLTSRATSSSLQMRRTRSREGGKAEAGKVRAEEALLWEPTVGAQSHANCTGFESPKSEYKAVSTGSASSVLGRTPSFRLQHPVVRQVLFLSLLRRGTLW